LTLDMSAAGQAVFGSGGVKLGGDLQMQANDVKFDDNAKLILGSGSDAEIYFDATNLLIDTEGDIILDANGGDIILKDNGTVFGTLSNQAGYFDIKATVSDQDIVFKGNDGGAAITALTLDMSSAAQANFTGRVGIKTDDTSVGALTVFDASGSTWVSHLKNTSDSVSRILYLHCNTDHDDNSSVFLYGIGGLGGQAVTRMVIYSDGDIYNHDNTYGSTSDQRIKQNITDASSQWDDIKSLRVRNFKRKDDVRQYGEDNAQVQLGLIAQETETVSPGLVKLKNPDKNDIASDSAFGRLYTSDDSETQGDNPTAVVGDVKVAAQVKQMKYSVLYMKAIKALQEAMDRIETLETKVQALEDA